MSQTPLLQLSDIQGLAMRGFGQLPYAGYLCFQISEPGNFRKWLNTSLEQGFISPASVDKTQLGTEHYALAFTAAGLQTLMGQHCLSDTFPIEFVEGMVEPQRSRLLGDLHANTPHNWRWGANNDIHGMLIGFAQQETQVQPLLNQAAQTEHGLKEITRFIGHVPSDGKEPFGFADGVSQPLIKGSPRALRLQSTREHQLHAIDPGEFILGYTDGSGELPRTPACSPAMSGSEKLPTHPQRPELRDFGCNGSFMVVRQLAQDVKAFEEYVATHSREGLDIGEKMMGRTREGKSITRDTQSRNDNDFDYLEDLQGHGCPIGSHVRRTNPRSTPHARTDEKALKASNRHRIIRRGRVYHNAEGEQGLVFVCLNASISRQFEFIQSSWSNDPFFQGLGGEIDPITGTRNEATNMFTMPNKPYRDKVKQLPQWVTVKGGGYFFLPGMRALSVLATPQLLDTAETEK